jgi:hypothetical protein
MGITLGNIIFDELNRYLPKSFILDRIIQCSIYHRVRFDQAT